MTNSSRSGGVTRRSVWKMMGVAGASLPLVSQAQAQSSPRGDAAGPPEGEPKPSRFVPPRIPPLENAGTGDSTPIRLLRLDGIHATLLLIVRRVGLPEIAYWGAKLPSALDAASVFAARAPDLPDNGPDQWRPLVTLLDTIGGWNVDLPGLVAERPDGTDWTAEFSVAAIDSSPGRIMVRGVDKFSNIEVLLTLSLDRDDVLEMHTALTNTGSLRLNVSRLVSGTFLLPETTDVFGVMHGAWAMEWGIASTELRNGALVVESRRNRSHDHFPGMLAGGRSTTQNLGEAFGVQLGWSGSHRICVERMEDARFRLSAGEYLYPGEGALEPGQTLTTAPVYCAYSPEGYAGLARAFQAYARHRIVRWPGGVMKPRPVLLNSWEGNHFDLKEAHLRQQIDAAAALGVERFVLDDGWFGARRNDTKGLGDWFVSKELFPHGLRPLADYARSRKMQFGLWYEPEMVNPDSDLYRTHPDWVLNVRGRVLLTSRQQVVLDISRNEVSDYLFKTISATIAEVGIDYIKWDFNRDLLDAADAQGRAAYRRQVLALYALWDRLHAAHPALEIESCASGGGRADWGALRHTQRVWTSDNTSALSRVGMQDAAWHFLPPEVTGTHISAVPNGIDKRVVSLDFRAAIALFGHLGIELDLLKLAPAERDRLRDWIALHKRLRDVLHHGRAQFGDEDKTRVVRGVTTSDGTVGVYLVALNDWPPVRRAAPVRLPGLDPEKIYRVTVPSPQTAGGNRPSDDQRRLYGKGLTLSGAILGQVGIYLPLLLPETALVLECRAE